MPLHRVLHLLDTSQVEWTGIAKMVAALAEWLDPKEYAVHAWFRRERGPLVEMLASRGVQVRVIDWLGGERDPLGIWRFLRAMQGQHFSIVHQHVGGRAVRWLSRHVGRARVVTHLHSRVLEQGGGGGVPVRWNLDGADLVIAASAAVAGWSGVKAEVVYPGIEVRPGECARPAGHGRVGHVIGAAGRLAPIKGIAHLLRALPAVRASVPDVKLEIAGAGPEEEALREQAAGLGLGECVAFLGWRQEVPYERWDVFAMPSLEESFGMAALEAMAAGLPVVASAVGGLGELVEDGKSGWLVPAGDSRTLSARIVELLREGHLREAMGVTARARAREFTVTRMCQRIEGLYRRLLA